MNNTYVKLKEFKIKYPFTIGWRLMAHSRIVEKHLNPEEKVLYAFCAQKDLGYIDFFNTHVIVLTNKRIMIVSKRILFGYHFKSITPDLYNDLTISKGIIWGRVIIDTVKEKVFLKYISGSALPEIETKITDYMIEAKKQYKKDKKKEDEKKESDE